MSYKLHKHFKVLSFKALSFLLLLQASSANAQTPNLTNSPSTQLIEKISLELGIPRTSKFYKTFLFATSPTQSNSNNEFISPNLIIEKKRDKNILRHIRSNKGIALPKAKNLEAIRYQPRSRTDAIHTKWRQALVENNTKPKLIPNCIKDSSDKLPSNFNGSKLQEETVLFDMLFIRKEYAPIDPEEIIGRQTIIIPYTQEKATMASIAASGVKIPCLPYRVRGTAKFFIKDQGLNALKNYDKDPNGSGSLHEIMKLKLQHHQNKGQERWER